jgi:hypothetical protein
MSPARKAPPRRKTASRRRSSSKGKTAPRRKRATSAKAAAGGKPRLRVIRRPARKTRRPAKAKAFPQTDGASAKQRLLFDLVRSHTAVSAAFQGMTSASAERPMGEGKWSARETVLHLVFRDRIRLRELEGALRGVAPSWRGESVSQQNQDNERDLATLRHHSWDEAVRLLHSTRRELMEAVESVPEEPAEVWSEDHAFGWMMWRLPAHDRHHADAIKLWRSASST